MCFDYPFSGKKCIFFVAQMQFYCGCNASELQFCCGSQVTLGHFILALLKYNEFRKKQIFGVFYLSEFMQNLSKFIRICVKN